MTNTTFTMTVNGTEFTVFNGTAGDCVVVENHDTGLRTVIRENGTYSNKSGVRKAIVKMMASQEIMDAQTADYEEYLGEKFDRECAMADAMNEDESAKRSPWQTRFTTRARPTYRGESDSKGIKIAASTDQSNQRLYHENQFHRRDDYITPT